jgi:hypothetical protein
MSHQPFFYLLYSIASDCEERMKDAYVAVILLNSLDIVVCKNGFCLAGGNQLEMVLAPVRNPPAGGRG